MADFTTFFPGPSQIHPKVPQYYAEGLAEGIGSISHRSAQFNEISERCIRALKAKLDIPQEYTIFYTNSATQNWEILAQSLTEKKSEHYYTGSFGERWFYYANQIHKGALGHAHDPNTLIGEKLVDADPNSEIICLTQNETSNATQIPIAELRKIRAKYPEKLIALDLTSSLAGIALPFEQLDIAYASVQKCFGLPAGLGFLVLSPRAKKKASKINDRRHYDSIPLMMEKMKKWQTNHTPNVIGIYALMRRMEDAPHIQEVDKETRQRAQYYYETIKELPWCSAFITNPSCLSLTVVAVKTDEETLQQVHNKCREAGILLGKGYGPYKEFTFRIANFPAHGEKEIEKLVSLLKDF